ncbi:response regulator transcription factor [Pseudogulbenkiania ferrooxidans]|uniref:Two component transcriptional regulator, winged helix family n=1 Tax=Pseudogulbenkiania ferrooxidans 2002 TaxID=279714 RepID=B9YZ48_9NEIS|nr:response regulator transcription factor [Pseudogulbenkiania ferrooxidans]EEG10401.1 two component transcriptional regulator, winged helix family [Pseudogulbenkiania ferrooxidans 2002]
MTHVLLVDDDIELSAMLADYLGQEGFRVSRAADGESGLREALSGRYAIVVLDVMMPRLNGIEVLRRLRQHSQVPVLMLTARGDDIDCIMGLELGADDYVTKPCAMRTLVARLKALLRRAPSTAAPTVCGPLAAGPLTLWPTRRHAECDGRALEMTGTEFNLLEVLVRHAGRIVSKHELSQQALRRPLARFDRSIDVHVCSIRQKLPPRPDSLSWIQTVRGMGYLFLAE